MPMRRGAAEVGVLQHDVRRLAAELEEDPLHGRGALLHDAPSHRGRPGEGDHVDLGDEGQLLTHQVVRGGDHVDHAGGDVGLLGDEPAEEGGVPRGVGCGLDDDRVAGGQGLSELVQRHLDREVPRHDGPHHADGLLPDPPGSRCCR